MKVQLMLTCLGDALFGSVGIATVKVLEAAGHEVVFPEGQTCCGQPPFNAGHWPEAQAVAQHMRSEFDASTAIVTPSASCAAMIRHGYQELDRGPDLPCYELTEFLTQFGVPRLRLKHPRRVAVHTACHGRMIGLLTTPESVVESIEGLELVRFAEREQCCGFGGAFAATHASLSAGIGDAKIEKLIEAEPDEVVSTDLGCLLHLRGRAAQTDRPLVLRHIAELLAEAIA